jgi:hypothetical protein
VIYVNLSCIVRSYKFNKNHIAFGGLIVVFSITPLPAAVGGGDGNQVRSTLATNAVAGKWIKKKKKQKKKTKIKKKKKKKNIKRKIKTIKKKK